MIYRYEATLVRVVDGDTVVLDVDIGFRIRTVDKFRLAGINTPEMNQAGGAAAKNYLEAELKDKPLIIHSYRPLSDKYGRWLTEIFVGDKNINEDMLAKGLAKPYNFGLSELDEYDIVRGLVSTGKTRNQDRQFGKASHSTRH